MDGREAELIGNYIQSGLSHITTCHEETNRILHDILDWQRSTTGALFQIADSLERLAPRPSLHADEVAALERLAPRPSTTGVYVNAPAQPMSSPTIEATGSTAE
jgi:hypothetical protein